MQRIARMVIMVIAPLLLAALWMDHQPAHKPYETPIPAAPPGSVPYAANASGGPQPGLVNPASPTAESLTQGKRLFAINCAMCHGQTHAQPGPVGTKLKPPPPGLGPELIKQRSDAQLFRAITLGFGRMPPFRDKLSAPERWDLVNFLRRRD